MYHYITDKDFSKRLTWTCSDIINQFVQHINRDSVMTVRAHLVGSGARRLLTQNETEPIDLDYNLWIQTSTTRIESKIKEYVRKRFNETLNTNGWHDCRDSTSALTTEKRHFLQGCQTPFSIDLAIICRDPSGWHRLIHEKTGSACFDRYYWNQVRNSAGLEEKASFIKSSGSWNDLRKRYLEKKNFYLRRNDNMHPSFVVYAESVNEIYQTAVNSRRSFT